jgi:hypothetical protein
MKNISNSGEKKNTYNMKWLYNYSAWTLFLWNLSHIQESKNLTLLKKLYVMDKSGYDFQIQRAETILSLCYQQSVSVHFAHRMCFWVFCNLRINRLFP